MTDFHRYQPRTNCLGRYQLSAVKQTLYNPHLPTLRRMDRDDAMEKLPSEHSRTTTLCSLDDFRAGRTTSATIDPPAPLACKEITSTGKSLQSIKIKPFEWRVFTRTVSSPASLPSKANTQFSGYAGRHFHPQITSAWRYTLRQEPSTEKTTKRPRPIPATIYSRHRDTFTTYGISSSGWH
ncbi:sperm microtubule inner protein 8-like isoform X2 [Oscarella lobularis]|uniref:sperm microtubule inner protein 8-like isoform X2 n=1 Tax=Oscarella lobularis TaxID=121494 RepID=UPI00331418F3